MIAGTFILTDTIRKAFDDLFVAQTRGADVVVSGRVDEDADFQRPPPLSEGVLEKIRALPEVEQAAGQLNDIAAVVGADGKVVATGGAPAVAATYMPPPFTAIEISEGEPPAGPGEIALDVGTAEEQGFEVGDRVKVAAAGPVRAYELVGLATFGSQTSIGATTVVVYELAAAQALFDKQGEVDFAFVAARDGVTAEQLRRAVDGVLPPQAQARTAAQEADALSDQIGDALGFLTTGLLAFGFIAVLVGAFLIFNTFSITVAQRARELALVRTLGATRRQVLSSVLLEALAIGTIGALVGLVAGFGFQALLDALFNAVGVDLPSTEAVVRPRTIAVSLFVGIVVTLVGAAVPALRATRVAPLEALREAGAPTGRTRGARAMPWVAGVLVVLGAGLVAGGLLTDGGDETTKLIGAAGGAVVLILGVALASPVAVRPTARIIGAPLERSTRLVGRLARENASRNPARTAVTSAALMIGLALVVFVTVFANGLRERADSILDRTFAGDLAVLHEDGFSTMPAAVAPAVAAVDGVASVSAIKASEAKVEGKKGTVFGNAIDPGTLPSVYTFDWVEGDDGVLGGLGSDGVLLEEGTATDIGADVGDRLEFGGVGGRKRTLVVRGVYRDDGILVGFAMPIATFDTLFDDPRITAALVDLEDDAFPRAEIDAALADFPEARARDQAELREETGATITQILGLFYALLAMSIVISIFGIVNTLTLSIHERTRELGLLRAVGMTKREVRRMIRYESVITAAFGALLGLALGVFFAFVVTRALADDGIGFSLPLGQVVALLIFSLIVGVLAAVLPARRASRLDVLRAISYE